MIEFKEAMPASTVRSLYQLGLSVRTVNTIENKGYSIAEAVGNGRWFAAINEIQSDKPRYGEVWQRHLIEGLDRFGYLRHDLHPTLFRMLMFYSAIEKENLIATNPCTYEDISLDDIKAHLISRLFDEALKEEQVAVMRYRYGFDDDKYHSVKETSQIFGIRNPRVRDIESNAIRILRSPNWRGYIPQIPGIKKCYSSFVASDRLISKLGLRSRTYEAIYQAGFRTIDDILNHPEKLRNVKNLGLKGKEAIEKKMHDLGYADFVIDSNKTRARGN